MRNNFWVLLFMQSASCLACLVCHKLSVSNDVEPITHGFLFGIYSFFWFYTIIAIIGYYFGPRFHLLTEIIINVCGSVFYVIAGLKSMAAVEKDYHLLYLIDDEELAHQFFQSNRLQSAISVWSGFLFLLNAFLELDMLFIKDDPAEKPVEGIFRTHISIWSIERKCDRIIDRTV